ncbi:hypothetical protein CIW69_13925 [Enterobacter cloacae]|nr:hypothetical protein CIW69_13925 [Enterobacter cloacae]
MKGLHFRHAIRVLKTGISKCPVDHLFMHLKSVNNIALADLNGFFKNKIIIKQRVIIFSKLVLKSFGDPSITLLTVRDAVSVRHRT